MKTKKKVKEKQKKSTALALTNVEALIETAVKSKAGVEQLQALMKMKYEHEAREAAKVFHDKFCSLQSELPVIPKEKAVKNYNGGVIYKYAPLEVIIKHILPFMQKYGFTYHWTESFEKEGYKRITCHITGHGHTESAYSDIPIPDATKMTNSIQQAGSATTYGKRYSLIGILGIIADEDDDAQSMKPVEKPKVENKPVAEKVEGPKAEKKEAPEAPPGPIRKGLQDEILELTKKMGVKTLEDAQTITGVKSLKDTKIELLDEICKRLRDEVDKKNGAEKKVDAPIENTELPFEKSKDKKDDGEESMFAGKLEEGKE